MTSESALLSDIALVLIVAGTCAVLFSKLKLPAVIGYLVAGILLGPHTPSIGVVQNVESVNLMASLGVILLMFSIGLDFSLKKLRKIGLFSVIAGSIEILIMMSLGYTLGNFLGWSHSEAIFLGAVMSISSTAIIIKVLSDLGKLEDGSTEAVIGILIVEDFVAVMILTLAAPTTSGQHVNVEAIMTMILSIIIFALVGIILGAATIPRIIDWIAKKHSDETLLLVSLGMCFAMSLISIVIGLSVAIGAFLMGAIISQSDYVERVILKITPIKEMFVAIFFVSIGMLIVPAYLVENLLVAIFIATIFMIGKAISVSFASYVANLDIRTSFHAGLNMIVMGEFSFIIAKMAVDTGAAGEFFYSTVISIALITALVYPLSVAKSDTIVDIFEKRTPRSVKAALSLIERLRAAMREKIASSNDLRKSIMKDIKWIFIDMTIIFVVTAAANYLYNYTGLMHDLSGVSPFLPLLLVSSITVILLIPPIYSIVRRIRAIVGVAVHIVLETGSYNSIGKKMIEKVFMNLFTIFIVIVSFVYLLSIVPIPPNMPYISPLVVIFVGIGVALVFRSTLKSVHQKMSVLLSKGIMDEREDSRRIK